MGPFGLDVMEYRSTLLTVCPCGRCPSSDAHAKMVRVPKRARDEGLAAKSGRSGLLKFARDLLPRFAWGG